jgi:hypothetical protein
VDARACRLSVGRGDPAPLDRRRPQLGQLRMGRDLRSTGVDFDQLDIEAGTPAA